MAEREPHRSCPVCSGATMVKLRPSNAIELVLDYCRRCGGLWFDKGEVDLLRQCHPKALSAHVELRDEAYRSPCRGCGASVKRNDECCSACKRPNRIPCPICGKELGVFERDGLRIDACTTCRGVWFDNVELKAIWNTELRAMARRAKLPEQTEHSLTRDYFPFEALIFAPDLAYFAAAGVADVATAAPEVAASAAAGVGDLAGAAVEGTGELAGSVFEAIAEIISSIF